MSNDVIQIGQIFCKYRQTYKCVVIRDIGPQIKSTNFWGLLHLMNIRTRLRKHATCGSRYLK